MAPSIPLKARIQLGLFSFITNRAIGHDDTVNRRLLARFEPLAPADPKPKSGVCTADVIIDSTRDLFVRIFVPSMNEEEAEKLPLVVYFHGGGFAFASPHLVSYDDWGRRMCSGLHAVIASVNYRRSPEHRCPAPYDDGVDVLRFLDSGGLRSVDILSSLDLDLDLGSCFLAGDTAGGNIVHHVARRWAATVDSWKKINIKGAIPITPMFGGEERTTGDIQNQNLPVLTTERMDWYWKVFLPEGANRNHECAHPFGTTTKLEERFPPVLVAAAGYDILRDWQLKYYEWLNGMKHNVRLALYPDSFHGFYLYTKCEEWIKLVDEMKTFVDEHKSS